MLPGNKIEILSSAIKASTEVDPTAAWLHDAISDYVLMQGIQFTFFITCMLLTHTRWLHIETKTKYQCNITIISNFNDWIFRKDGSRFFVGITLNIPSIYCIIFTPYCFGFGIFLRIISSICTPRNTIH